MSQYAQVHDENVLQVIEADAAHIAERPELDVGKWVLVPEGQQAYIGGTYNESANVFIPPCSLNGWVLNENYEWVPPIPYPDSWTDPDISVEWNNTTLSWTETAVP